MVIAWSMLLKTDVNSFKKNEMFIFLMVLTIASVGGLQVWRTLFNNFAVEQAGLNGSHVGMINSIREVPGFLALLAIYILLVIKEHRLSALSVLIMGIGIGVTGFFPSYYGLIFTTLFMSFGFHYYETTNQSLTLQFFDKKTAPLVFGKLRGYAALASIIAAVIIYLLSFVLSFKLLYFFFGIAVASAAIWGFFQNPVSSLSISQNKKMVFRKRYWLFYVLTCLAGARRQIFVVFSIFLMVEKFGFSIKEITILFLINNLINYFVAPQIGKAINFFGERKVLSLEYFSLVFIFIMYAYTDSKIIVSLMYILDHLFFNFSIAIRTFFQKIGDEKDYASTMAVGFTINHLVAIVLPVIGGMLWMYDYRLPFFIGAVISVVSLIFTQQIKQYEDR